CSGWFIWWFSLYSSSWCSCRDPAGTSDRGTAIMISAKSDVQVDTPEVRVTEWRLAPGSATGHHTHEMDYVIVPVTSGEMNIVAPNGGRAQAPLGVGEAS